MAAAAPIQCFPRYENANPWELEDLTEGVRDGMIDAFVFDMFAQKDKLPLGTFSFPLTKPVHGLSVYILVDLNTIEKENRELYTMRVKDEGDGFMDIKTDIDSVQMAVLTILENKMPLHNVSKDINVCDYPFILV